jgi:hypothetical protein
MNLALDATLKLLRSYSCLTPKTVTPAEKVPLQQAILEVIKRSQGQDFGLNFGVCADTPDQAIQALCSYLKGLAYTVDLGSIPEESIAGVTGVTYLKYNLQRQAFYLDDYTGTYRGVLIACQGDETVAGTYGYFPLDLFDECHETYSL